MFIKQIMKHSKVTQNDSEKQNYDAYFNGNSRLIKIITLVSGVCMAIAVHTGTLIWVLSAINTTVQKNTQEILINSTKTEDGKQYFINYIDEKIKPLYTTDNAERDKEFYLRELNTLTERLNRIEDKSKK